MKMHLKEKKLKRICNVCKREMDYGYVIDDGEEYYCSDECLWSMYSEEEYDELCQEDLAYWTEWYDE